MDAYLCPKCGSEMVQGFIPDAANGTSMTYCFWVSGEAEISRWTGAVKDKAEREWWKVVAWRCVGCGFIEQWALEQVKPPSWAG